MESFGYSLLFGGTAEVISKTLTAPIERVRILLQTQNISTQISADKKYKGILDAFVRIKNEQGVLAFWRGNWVNLVRYFPTQSLNFAFKDTYNQLLLPKNVKKEKISTIEYQLRFLLSGGLAGATVLLGTYPLDLIRTRITVDIEKTGATRYSGIYNCAKSIYHTEGGMRGLYKGFGIAVCGIFVYRAVFFGGHDIFKNAFLSPDSSYTVKYLVAYSSTITAACIGYPFDTTKKYMHLRAGGSDKIFNSSIDCVKKIFKQYGPAGFYRGFYASVIRSIGGGLTLFLYDEAKHYVTA